MVLVENVESLGSQKRMKFKEEFPSFKGDGTKGTSPLEMTTAEYIGRLVTEIPFRYKEGCGPTIRLWKEEKIQKHCIDKQKVRDKIRELMPEKVSAEFKNESVNDKRKDFAYFLALQDLLKELGLEE